MKLADIWICVSSFIVGSAIVDGLWGHYKYDWYAGAILFALVLSSVHWRKL